MQAWPTTLFMSDWPSQAQRGQAVVAHLKQQAEGFDKPIASGVATSAKSAMGLVESPLNLFPSATDPDLKALVDWIDGCVRAAVSKVNGGNVPPERLEVEFTESWFHITNHGGFHDAHVHGGCSWCGIFYLASGDPDTVPADGAATAGNGINRFYNPVKSGGLQADFGNRYLRSNYLDVQPMDGRLILFPSYLLHSALPYQGVSDRVVLAFNTRTRTV